MFNRTHCKNLKLDLDQGLIWLKFIGNSITTIGSIVLNHHYDFLWLGLIYPGNNIAISVISNR